MGENISLDRRTVLKAKVMDCVHHFEGEAEIMESDLSLFGSNSELGGMPLNFRSLGVSGRFWVRAWTAPPAGLTVRVLRTRVAVITLSLRSCPALRVAFMLVLLGGRVFRRDDRCGGLTTATDEFLEKITNFPDNGYCQHHFAPLMYLYSTPIFLVFQVVGALK